MDKSHREKPFLVGCANETFLLVQAVMCYVTTARGSTKTKDQDPPIRKIETDQPDSVILHVPAGKTRTKSSILNGFAISSLLDKNS